MILTVKGVEMRPFRVSNYCSNKAICISKVHFIDMDALFLETLLLILINYPINLREANKKYTSNKVEEIDSHKSLSIASSVLLSVSQCQS
jgi:hypothetical protein